MSRPVYISPSLLAADMARLADAIARVAEAADYIHCDVMDGHFVPNLTFGVPVVAAVKRFSPLPLDVHLMIARPEAWIERFIAAGLGKDDFLTFHLEACADSRATISRIRSLGVRPGISIKPGTDINLALPYLEHVDQLLVMTVEPGFGGQSFMSDMIPKIETARRHAGDRLIIAVDGGIDPGTALLTIRAGANLLVAGSSIYSTSDPVAAINSLRTAASL